MYVHICRNGKNLQKKHGHVLPSFNSVIEFKLCIFALRQYRRNKNVYSTKLRMVKTNGFLKNLKLKFSN